MAEERIITMMIILSTVILISLVGNLLVVGISVFYIRLQSLTVIFILNLALSDLLSTVGLIFSFCENIWNLPFGDAACRVASFFHSTGFYSSIIFLALMSFQHYMAIVDPLSVWKKGRGFTTILICVWVLSFLAALPAIEQSVALDICMYNSSTAVLVAITYRENIVFVCAFLFNGFCYIRILQTILKSPTNQNQRHRTTGLTFLLVASFFICWAPYNIMKFLYTLIYYQIWSLNLDHFFNAYYICRLLAFSHCCLNPVIYGLSDLKFHETEREILQRRATFNSAGIETQEHLSSSS
ncbi:chemokine XC receptor 1-like [Hemibagrus wyckioides]|uniref:chemokine XC receptor 1-like n=1 Tax=Hemibagrus wyckioides TaxID=337641 RepID=UPI00266C91BF|nr:chemokine XC receptor 1-like [Hemibagrus wyckioides]